MHNSKILVACENSRPSRSGREREGRLFSQANRKDVEESLTNKKTDVMH